MIPRTVPAAPVLPASPNRTASGGAQAASPVMRRHLRRRKLRWVR